MLAAPVQYDISPGRKGGKVRDVLNYSPWSRAFFNPSSTRRRYLVIVEDRSDNIPSQVCSIPDGADQSAITYRIKIFMLTSASGL